MNKSLLHRAFIVKMVLCVGPEIAPPVIPGLNVNTNRMKDKATKCAEAQMLIRKPVTEVFQAFIDPAITKNFWFTKSSGKLELNKKVTWEWEMYNVSTTVIAKEILPGKKILFEWDDPQKTVEFKFETIRDGSTYVSVMEWGYNKTGDELIAQIKDSTGGFTTVLDGLKAFLEHGINLNLIPDKYPREIMEKHSAPAHQGQ
jgi:uncharacterized protein YndB with AHSA1/START domain